MPQMEDDNNQAQSVAPQNEGGESSFWELVKYAIIALIVVVPFRIFIAQPYVVSGSSMDPTFKDGDYLIVDQLSRRFEDPPRNSVIIIRYPKDPSKFFIKRLIAFPGEKVVIKKGVVTVFNKDNPDGIILDDSYVEHKKTDDFSAQLGDNEYFVMGDNRAASSDSRIWGSVPKEDIIGEPVIRLLPVTEIGVWPGALKNNE